MFDHDVYCLEGEEWRDIPDYEGIYQASSFGRIRTVNGKQTHSVRHGLRTWRGKVLKSRGMNPKTGHRVTLWKDKKCKDALVARLVGMAFLGVPDDAKMTINHKDGNRFNNHISNLEWLTIGDNVRHAFENDLVPTCKSVDVTITFKSLAQASRFLGRNDGYLCNCIINKKNAQTVDGQPVEFKLKDGVG